MKKLLALAVFTLVAACTSLGVSQTPAQKVFAATSAYDAALTVAVVYKKLPVCGDKVPKPCSEPAIVAVIQKADTVAFEALKGAQTVVRSNTASQSAIQTAVTWATEAIAAFNRVTQGVK